MKNQQHRNKLFNLWVLLSLFAALKSEQPADIQTAGPLFFLFLGAIALAVVAGLLMPKPKGDTRFDDRPPTTSRRGEQLSYVIGRRVVSPKVMWVGRRFSRRESVEGGGGKKGFLGGGGPKQTVYYEDGLHAICLGPASALHKISAAEKGIFPGFLSSILQLILGLPPGSKGPPITPQNSPSGTMLQDNKGNSFTIYWGEENQPINTDLGATDALGVASRWPFYCYIHWHARRLGTSAVWPQMDYDIEAQCVGRLQLPDSGCYVPETSEGAEDDGINAAHIVYQLMTGSYPHGAGINPKWLDGFSLRAIGVKLEAEALPHNILIKDDTPLQSILGDLFADATIFVMETNGDMAFVLLRSGETPLALTENLIVDPLPQHEIEHGGMSDDRIVYLYPDVKQNFRDTDMVTDDDASAAALRRKRTREIRMTTITHERLAALVGDRRKQLLLADASQITFTVNRTMRRLLPGHVATMPDVGEIRITAIEPRTDSHKAKVTASINQYDLPPSDWVPVNPPPDPPTGAGGVDDFVRILEVPRRYAGESLAIGVVRGRSLGDQANAQAFVSTDNISFEFIASVNQIAAFGKLTSDLIHFPTDLSSKNVDREQLVGPTIELLSGNPNLVSDLSGQDDQWRGDRQVILIDDELLALRSVTALGGDLFQTNDIVRAQLHTDAGQHEAINEPVITIFDPQDLVAFSRSEWVVGQTIYVKVVPEGVAIDQVTSLAITFRGLALGPLPVIDPHTTNIAATPSTQYGSGTGDIVFAWGYGLNKGSGAGAGELKAGLPVPVDPGIEGEFIVRIRQVNGVLSREITGITVPTWTYTSANRTTDGFTTIDFILEIVNISGASQGYIVQRKIRHNALL